MTRKTPTETAANNAAFRNLNTAITRNKTPPLPRCPTSKDSRLCTVVWSACGGLKMGSTAMMCFVGLPNRKVGLFQATAKIARRSVSPTRGVISSRCAMRCARRKATRLAVSQILVRSSHVLSAVRIRSAVRANAAVNRRASWQVSGEYITVKILPGGAPFSHDTPLLAATEYRPAECRPARSRIVPGRLQLFQESNSDI
jgi:hypothetical protein